MEYPCSRIPIAKLLIGVKGIAEPLCTHCKNKDCTNPIEWKKISIMGITKKHRVFLTSGSDVFFVLNCPEGFIPDET